MERFCKNCGEQIEVQDVYMNGSVTWRHVNYPRTMLCLIDGEAACTRAEPRDE